MKKIIFLCLVSIASFGQKKKPVVRTLDTLMYIDLSSMVNRELSRYEQQEISARTQKLSLMLFLISVKDSTAIGNLTEYPYIKKGRLYYKINKK